MHVYSPMKPPLAMLTYSLFFCNRRPLISEGKNRPGGSLCCLQLPSLHSPAGNEPTPCSCTCPPPPSHCPWSTGALRWRWSPTPETASEPPGATSPTAQTRRGSGASVSTKESNYLKYLFISSFHAYTESVMLALTRSESRWKAVERCPELYCSAGRQSTTKKRTPSWKKNLLLSHQYWIIFPLFIWLHSE